MRFRTKNRHKANRPSASSRMRRARFELLELRLLLAADFGDAPWPYPTVLAADGAWHEAVGPTLGALRDVEPDGQATGGADGDRSDEDGIYFAAIHVGQQDAVVTVNVQNAPGGGVVDAWIDFNRDGSFDGFDERIVHGVSVTAGDNQLLFDVPQDAISGSPLVTRFRISSAGGLGPRGGATDGEVEDHLLVLSSAGGSGVFEASPQSISSNDNSTVDLGDIDGDGDLDVVSGEGVWLNQGGGQGGAAGVLAATGQSLTDVFTSELALGDIDGDGDLDVLIAGGGANGNRIWLNSGGIQEGVEGTFTDSGQTLGDGAVAVALGDLDGDGDLDVFVANEFDSDRVWLNQGGLQGGPLGTFADSEQALSGVSHDVELGDLDGDGDLDAFVVTRNYYYGRNRIWLNTGGAQGGTAGTFVNSGQPFGETETESVALGDFDRDGDLDAVLANRSGARLHVNQGGAQAGLPGVYSDSGVSLALNAVSVQAGDFDGDHDLDAVFVTRDFVSGGIEVWVNGGGQQSGSVGTFVKGPSLATSQPFRVAAGVLDAVAGLDLYIAALGADETWFNAPPVNLPPLANPDTAAVLEDGTVTIDVLTNDSPGENEIGQTVRLISAAADIGSVTVNADGTLTYTPPADYFGTAHIDYIVEDRNLTGDLPNPARSAGVVNVTVAQRNDAPIALPDHADFIAFQAINIDVLANDLPGPSNEGHQSLRVIEAYAGHGTVTINLDGTLTYTPDASVLASDTIHYVIIDDGMTAGELQPLTASASVTIELIAVPAVTVIQLGSAIYASATGNGEVNVGQRTGSVYFQGSPASFDAEQITDIYINGTNGEDTIRVLPGHFQGLGPDERLEAILHIDGAGGDDTIRLDLGQYLYAFVPTPGMNEVWGGGGNDLIFGSFHDDYLDGGSGADEIRGQRGNDRLLGDEGNDRIFGGDGNDSIFGGLGDDRLSGEQGDDDIDGGGGSNSLAGDHGNDRLWAFRGDVAEEDRPYYVGSNSLFGGDGDDVLYGWYGDDLLSGSAGDDHLYAGAGVQRLSGGDGNDLLVGNIGDDVLNGDADNDVIYGGAGKDSLLGQAGDDQLYGEDGDDSIQGYVGNDLLVGGFGADDIFGHDGDDVVYGGLYDPLVPTLYSDDDSRNIIRGDSGNDYIVGGQARDIVFAGSGDDIVYGGAGDDQLSGHEGNDEIFGGDGDDRIGGDVGIDSLAGDSGNDSIFADDVDVYLHGGAGQNSISFVDAGRGVNVWFAEAEQMVPEGTMLAIGFQDIQGTLYDDSLIAASQSQISSTIRGLAGDDVLSGAGGNDILLGGDGNDIISGQAGDDRLEGELGDDSLDGDAGADILYGGLGADYLEGGDGDDALYGPSVDEMNNLEVFRMDSENTLKGGAGADLIYGGPADDVIYGGDDADEIYASRGDDEVFGDQGDDSIDGGEGSDEIHAGDGNDRVSGGNQANTIHGDSGDDVLEGGFESDLIYGGSGNDTVYGFSGDDRLQGDEGDDLIDGGEGIDTIDGGDGHDTLSGGDTFPTVRDVLSGGSGNDILSGGAGAVLSGDAGNDDLTGSLWIAVNVLFGWTVLSGGSGDDTFRNGGVRENGDVDFVATDTSLSGVGSDTLSNIVALELTGGPSPNRFDLTQFSGHELSIHGGGGYDTLSITGKSVRLSDTELNGSSVSSLEEAIINGTDDRDLLNASQFSGRTLIHGFGGNDSLSLGTGGGSVFGGAGDDSISVASILDTDLDISLSLYGESGHDHLSLTGRHVALRNDNLNTHHLVSSLESAQILGTAAMDFLSAAGFTNRVQIYGLGGNDTIEGGTGDDYLDGGTGNDRIYSGLGDDALYGGPGDDTLVSVGGSGSVLFGEAGNDTLDTRLVNVGSLDGGTGTDKVLAGGDQNMVIRRVQSLYVDYWLFYGPNSATVLSTATDIKDIESLQLDGGAGANVIDATDYLKPITINGGAGDDSLYGGASSDKMTGGAGHDWIYGRAGNDTIDGNEGNDSIVGQGGNDIINGGIGADTLWGEGDNDQLRGGDGNDQIVGGSGDDVILGEMGHDRIWGEDGHDSLSGGGTPDDKAKNWGDDIIEGQAGNDLIFGGAGKDIFFGGSGSDTIEGGPGDDQLVGGDGDDYLKGEGGYDKLWGGKDNDTLNGGSAVNELYGEEGIDSLASDSTVGVFDYGPDDPTEIAVSNAEVEQEIIDYFNKFSGNSGSVDLNKLVFRPASRVVYGEYRVNYRQSGGLGSISGGFSGHFTYDWSRNEMVDTSINIKIAGKTVGTVDVDQLKSLLGKLGTNLLAMIRPKAEFFAADAMDYLTLAADHLWDQIATNNYNDKKSKYLGENPTSDIYFASESLVNWMGPETVAAYGAALGLTSGAAAPAILEDIKRRAVNELVGFKLWANAHGIPSFEQPSVFEDAIRSALGISPNQSNFKSFAVQYSYAGGLGGTTHRAFAILFPKASVSRSGTASRGHLSGATVLFDANRNGIQDQTEPTAFTDAVGNFTIQIPADYDRNANSLLDDDEGQWVVTGGVDSSTGLTSVDALTAPASFRMITPLTSLVSELTNHHFLTVEQASDRVLQAFGLPPLPLDSFDPISETLAGNAAGPAVFGAHAIVQDTISQIRALLSGMPNRPEEEIIAEQVLAKMADRIAQPGSLLDLGQATTVQDLLTSTASSLSMDLETELATQVSSLIAVTNQLVESIPLANSQTYLLAIANLKAVTQGEISDRLVAVAEGLELIDDVIAENDPESLAARIHEMTPPLQIVAPTNLTLEATSSEGAVAEFDVYGVSFVGEQYPVASSFPNGGVAPLGSTTVELVLEGLDGPIGRTFEILVLDTTPPTLDVPADIVVVATSAAGAIVEVPGATASDLVDPAPFVVSDTESGIFPVGRTRVTYIATDAAGNSGMAGIWVTILPQNNSPTIQSDGVAAIALVGDTAVKTGEFGDIDGDEVVITSSIGQIAQSGDQNGIWTWSFDVSSLDESQDVILTATDSRGASSTISFGFVAFNQAPIPKEDTVVAVEDTELTVAAELLLANDIDVDSLHENLEVTEVFDALHGNVVLNANGSISFIPDRDFNGVAGFSYKLADEDQSVVSHVSVVVGAVNDPPSITSDLTSVRVSEGHAASNSGTFDDVDSDTMTLAASVGVVIDNGDGTWNWFYRTQDGPDQSQIVTITATDSDGTATTVTFALTVSNVAPTVTMDRGSLIVSEGEVASNSGSYGDAGSDDVTLIASIGSVAASVDGTWSWTYVPMDGPLGNQTVTITAVDDDGLQTSTSFILTVNNVAPTLTVSSASVSVIVGQLATNTGTFADVSADPVTLSATLGTVVANPNGTWSWNYPTTTVLSATVVTITATDDEGAQSQVSFSLAVNAGVVLLPNGTLQILGTSGNDIGLAYRVGSELIVHATFLPRRHSWLPWGSVSVNLREVKRIWADFGDGDDVFAVSDDLTIPTTLLGGNGGDMLSGGGGLSLLLGGDGNDLLYGGSGRGMLIGGFGEDVLLGGAQDDILIGGSTRFDSDDAALMTIMAAWSKASSYEARVTTVTSLLGDIDDEQADFLAGGDGRDLFSNDLGDLLTDVKMSGKKKETILE